VGILSSADRDDWHQAREKLLMDATNAQTLETIETALLLLCLDPDDIRNNNDNNSLDEALAHTVHASGLANAAANRFWDKTLQLWVTPNGHAGLTVEHTPAEAVIAMRIAQHALRCA